MYFYRLTNDVFL